MNLEIQAPDKTQRIRELNDSFRRTFVGGAVMTTPGVNALAKETKAELLRRVRAFDRFTNDNDPHGEHDFGSVKIGPETFLWKIDYYEPSLKNGSPDPSNPKVTTRILTVMLASEY